MDAETLRCPTCRAVQPWSDECRRCKSDLRLMRQAAEACTALRGHCFANLRENRIPTALAQTRQCLAMRDAADTRRLLAVCELLSENWSQAKSLAFQALEGKGDFN